MVSGTRLVIVFSTLRLLTVRSPNCTVAVVLRSCGVLNVTVCPVPVVTMTRLAVP